VGFNASLMADAPYAVIVAPAGVSERRMANHAAGAALAGRGGACVATGGALPSGQTAQADDPFALAQAREAKKKRKAAEEAAPVEEEEASPKKKKKKKKKKE
jgi:hypothetical protein